MGPTNPHSPKKGKKNVSWRGEKMSAREPPALERGLVPKKPERNRVMARVAMLAEKGKKRVGDSQSSARCSRATTRRRTS